MEEAAQRIRRLARDLCSGEPLGKKGVLQAVLLRLRQLGPVDHSVYLLMDRAYEGDKTRALALELGYKQSQKYLGL